MQYNFRSARQTLKKAKGPGGFVMPKPIGVGGFTIIELLVVIAIIALLSVVIAAQLSDARMRARDAKRITDLEIIRKALELYSHDSVNGNFPAANSWLDEGQNALSEFLAPHLENLPTPPTGEQFDVYFYAYDNSGDPVIGNHYPTAYLGTWLEDASNEALGYKSDYDGNGSQVPNAGAIINGLGNDMPMQAYISCGDNYKPGPDSPYVHAYCIKFGNE